MLAKIQEKLPIKGEKLPEDWTDYEVGHHQELVIETQSGYGPAKYSVQNKRTFLGLKRGVIKNRMVKNLYVRDIEHQQPMNG